MKSSTCYLLCVSYPTPQHHLFLYSSSVSNGTMQTFYLYTLDFLWRPQCTWHLLIRPIVFLFFFLFVFESLWSLPKCFLILLTVLQGHGVGPMAMVKGSLFQLSQSFEQHLASYWQIYYLLGSSTVMANANSPTNREPTNDLLSSTIPSTHLLQLIRGRAMGAAA